MTAHDPALVERLVQAAEDWLAVTDPFDGLDAYDRERVARMLTGKHLDVLAAEGRLCEPGEVEQLRIVQVASVGAHALLEDAEAEVDRLHTRIGELTPHRPVPNSTEWPIPTTSCADADRAADEQIAGLLTDCQRLEAEQVRLAAALAEVVRALDSGSIQTCSRGCKHAACGGPIAAEGALRVAGEALTVPPVAPLGADGETVCICTVSQRCSLHADGGGPG